MRINSLSMFSNRNRFVGKSANVTQKLSPNVNFTRRFRTKISDDAEMWSRAYRDKETYRYFESTACTYTSAYGQVDICPGLSDLYYNLLELISKGADERAIQQYMKALNVQGPEGRNPISGDPEFRYASRDDYYAFRKTEENLENFDSEAYRKCKAERESVRYRELSQKVAEAVKNGTLDKLRSYYDDDDDEIYYIAKLYNKA